jgi:hypothetical protein
VAIAAAVIGFVLSALLIVGIFTGLNTLARGVEAAVGGSTDSSPFSAPDEDAAIEGVSSGFPSDLSWAFRLDGMLSRGWAAVQRWPLPLMIGGVALTAVDASSSSGNNFDGLAEMLEQADTESVGLMLPLGSDGLAASTAEIAALTIAGLALFAFMFALVLALSFVRSWLVNGWLMLHRGLILNGEGVVSTLFTSFDRMLVIWFTRVLAGLLVFLLIIASMLPPMMVWGVGLIAGQDLSVDPTTPVFLAFGGTLLLMVPTGVYFSLGTWLAPWFVVYDGSSAWTALLQSWDAARGNRMTLFLFFFVQYLIGLAALILGLLLCCVGALVTVPLARAITDLATSRAWLTARHGADRALEFKA